MPLCAHWQSGYRLPRGRPPPSPRTRSRSRSGRSTPGQTRSRRSACRPASSRSTASSWRTRHARRGRNPAGGDLRLRRHRRRHRHLGRDARLRARCADPRDRGGLCGHRRSILVRQAGLAAQEPEGRDREPHHVVLDQRRDLARHRARLRQAARRQGEADRDRRTARDLHHGDDRAGRHRLGRDAVRPQGVPGRKIPHHRARQRRAEHAQPDHAGAGGQRLNALKERKDVMLRFMRAYRETLDWMYADPQAVKFYAEKMKLPEELVVMQRDQFNPKDAMLPDRLSDLDLSMEDAVALKFLDKPLTKEELAELFQIPPAGS